MEEENDESDPVFVVETYVDTEVGTFQEVRCLPVSHRSSSSNGEWIHLRPPINEPADASLKQSTTGRLLLSLLDHRFPHMKRVGGPRKSIAVCLLAPMQHGPTLPGTTGLDSKFICDPSKCGL